jgi:hypothetical protein
MPARLCVFILPMKSIVQQAKRAEMGTQLTNGRYPDDVSGWRGGYRSRAARPGVFPQTFAAATTGIAHFPGWLARLIGPPCADPASQ